MTGQYRLAQDVKPGWFVRHDGSWHKVSVFAHSEEVPSGRERAHFTFSDGCAVSYDFGERLLTLTAREARAVAAQMGGDR